MVAIAKEKSAKASFGRLWREVRDDLTAHRWLLFTSIFTLVAQVGFQLLIPWPIKLVFDEVLLDPARQLTIGATSIGTSWSIMLLSFLVVLASALRSLSSYVCKLSLASLSAKLLKGLREKLYYALKRDSSGRHHEGDLAIRLTTDVERLRNAMIHVLLMVFVRRRAQ